MLEFIEKSSKIVNFFGNPITDQSFLERSIGIKKPYQEKYQNWYNIDNELYYFKKISSEQQLINELLGPYLANFFGLEAINYQLSIHHTNKNKNPGLISKSIFNPDNSYKNLSELVDYNIYGEPKEECLEDVIDLCKNDYDKYCLMLEALKLATLGFYSHQTDHCYINLDFQIEPTIALAPIYDFEESFDINSENKPPKYFLQSNINWFEEQRYIYKSQLITIIFSRENLKDFFEKYPEFYQRVISILDLDLIDILKTIEKQYDLTISASLKEHYLTFDEKQKQFTRTLK